MEEAGKEAERVGAGMRQEFGLLEQPETTKADVRAQCLHTMQAHAPQPAGLCAHPS